MEKDPHPTRSQLVTGGLIRLQARSAPLGAWLSPAWAALCGITASNGFGWQAEHWLGAALLVLLVDGGWGTLWATLSDTDWSTPFSRWRSWQPAGPVATTPFTRPGAPGDRLSRWLGQLRSWWREALWPTCGSALSAIAVALPVTLVLSVVLGPELVLLSLAALAAVQLGLMVSGRRGVKRFVGPAWDAIITVALPWLAGHVAFGRLTPSSTGLALLLALAWGAAWQVEVRWGRVLAMGTQLAATAILLLLHRPLEAGGTLLLLAPQLALLPWLHRVRPIPWYVRHTRPWLMAAMLVAAWAL